MNHDSSYEPVSFNPLSKQLGSLALVFVDTLVARDNSIRQASFQSNGDGSLSP